MFHKQPQGGEIPDALRAPEPVNTSDAAGKKASHSAGDVRFMIVEALRYTFPSGATSDELAAYLRVPYKNAQPRCSDLKRDGLIKDSGLRRPNADGNPVTVWVRS